MKTIPITVMLSFALAVILTPLVREFARRRGILDLPDAERKLHAKETPLGGGLAVFLATVAAVFAALVAGAAGWTTVGSNVVASVTELVPLLAAATVIVAIGLFDDVRHLRGRQKLAGQLLAVAILVGGGLQVENIEVLGARVELGLLAIPFTVLWMLGAINSLNLLDGADGFATTIGIVIAATLALITFYTGRWTEALIAGAMVGALLGFLLYNFPPSSIFLGDCGSMLIGLVVGALAIYGNLKGAATVTLATPAALLAVPFFDSVAAIIRRTLTGRGVAIGDRSHLHHSMMRRGFGPRRLVIAAALLSSITAVGALASVLNNNEWYAVFGAAVLVAVLVGSRVFGFNELRLVANRAISFGESLVPKRSGERPVRQRKVGLVGSRHCDDVWQALTEFANEHKLSRVRLDLNGSWMDDGHDVLWEHITPQATVENWQTSLPIFAQGRIFGKVEIAGTVFGSSGQHILAPLGKLLESLEPRIDRLIDNAARQGMVLHTGFAKRVLFINRSYWPDCEATGQLLTELCEDLAKSFDVSVLAGQPNHVADQQSFRATGIQRRNHVEIYRVRHSQFRKRSMFGKACNLLSFLLAAIWQSFFIPKHQVVVVETDPFLLSLLGGMLKRWRGSRLVIYVQDVYPDVALAIGKVREGIITRTVRSLLLRAYDAADRIVVLGEDMGQRLIRQGVSPQKILCIPNWIDTETVYPIKHDNDFRTTHGLDGKFVVMHSGNMGLTQQLDQLMEVADRLRARDDMVFLLVGDGASRQRLERVAQQKKLENVRFLPYQSRENLALSLSAADLHVVSMHPAISGCLVPSKVYGIMASGSPVLAIVPDDTDVYRLVNDEHIGITVAVDELDELEATLVRCADGQLDLEAMGVRARKLAEARFDRRHSVDAFSDLLEKYMQRKAPTKEKQPETKPTLVTAERLPAS